MTALHIPVLAEPTVSYWLTNPKGRYVDGTFGRGGHSQMLLDRLAPEGQLQAFDQDATAIAHAQAQFHDARFQITHCNFVDLKPVLQSRGWWGDVDGILLDIGVSSPQLDEAERGFSFQKSGPLDMRMDTRQALTAAQWLADTDESQMAQVFKHYGDERLARHIARAIVQQRQKKPLTDTLELAQLIEKVYPAKLRYQQKHHPATKTFQAIRIEINQELTRLEEGLAVAFDALKPGGRLAVITFHSLEDRMVKSFFRHKTASALPSHLPVVESERQAPGKLVLRKVGPTQEEIHENPRARSAKLRVLEKQ